MKIYNEHAEIYHELYTDIFDYESEYEYYGGIFKENGCKKLLEIGCGSGHLAKYFINDPFFDYVGLDLSPNMISIAKKTNPSGYFQTGDMRNLETNDSYDGILIAGRSFCHLTENSDIIACLNSIHQVLGKNGMFVFDNFNADVIFLEFRKKSENKKQVGNKIIHRISTNNMNLKTGWTWNWESEYTITEDDDVNYFKDSGVLRAFTIDELKIFLEMNGFAVMSSKVHPLTPSALLTITRKK